MERKLILEQLPSGIQLSQNFTSLAVFNLNFERSNQRNLSTKTYFEIMLPVQNNSATVDIIILSSAIIGITLAIILAVFILMHVSNNYYNKFISGAPNQQNGLLYIFALLYATSNLISSLSYAFIRSNFFTQMNISRFTQTQCTFGFIMFYGFAQCSFALLNTIFLTRIRMIFKDSIYEYKPYIYKILHIAIFIGWLLSTLDIIIRSSFGNSNYKIYYTNMDTIFPQNGLILAYCGNSQPEQWEDIMITFEFTMHFIINVILLYMFNRGLWLLNKENMKRNVIIGIEMERSKLKIHPVGNDSALPTRPTLSHRTSEQLKIVVEKYKSEGVNAADDVKRVVELYNLIKKQTILICIASFSTILLGIGFVFDGRVVLEFGWDLSINVICVWMMLSTSKKYWNCCKAYGLCKCCYLRTGNVRIDPLN